MLSKYIENQKINEISVYEDAIFENDQASKDCLEEEWNGCIFKNVDFTKVKLEDIDMIDCVFENCDLSNLRFGSTFIRCEFRNCKLLGWLIDKTVCKNLLFEDCVLDLSVFSDSSLHRVLFKKCSLKDTRLFHLENKEVEFQNCDLESIEIIDTKLKDIDLSSCKISGIKFYLKDIEGVILESNQLVDIAQQLGIVLK